MTERIKNEEMPFSDTAIDVNDDNEMNSNECISYACEINETKKMIDICFDLEHPSSLPTCRIVPHKGNIYESEAPDVFKGMILEFEGKYKGYGMRSGTIALETNGKDIMITPIENTIYSASITERDDESIAIGDSLYIIAINIPSVNTFAAVCIIRADEKETFMAVKSVFGRAAAIRKFYTAFKGKNNKQRFIEIQRSGEKFKRFEGSNDISFTRDDEQRLKYALCKENYPYATQREIESMQSDSNYTKAEKLEKLKYWSNISTVSVNRKHIDKQKLRISLREKLSRIDRVIDEVVDFVAISERAENKGFKILLVGSTGTGKKSIMINLAEFVNMPYAIINPAATLEISGSHPTFQNATVGRVFLEFYKNRTADMMLIFPEIDNHDRGLNFENIYSVYSRLMQGMFEDSYMQSPYSIKNTVLAFTANSTDDMPEYIMDGFDLIIYMDDYSVDDKVEIAKKHIIPKQLHDLHIKPSEISFSSESINTIASEYCEYGGVKDMESNVRNIIRHMISSDDLLKGRVVTSDDVRKILGPLQLNNPGVIFNRYRDEYDEVVAAEIMKTINELKRESSNTGTHEAELFEKRKLKLECLLACRGGDGSFFKDFDHEAFKVDLHKILYGKDKEIDELAIIFYSASLNGSMLKANIMLVGGAGTGKTAIGEWTARIMRCPFFKLSLNGINDVHDLKGHSFTYVGSRPSPFSEYARKTGNTFVLVQLDELDKMKPELAEALLDVLDRKFVDNFLGVAVELKDTIFIATANDLSRVPMVVRNRFNVINVGGYTRQDKKHIVSEYLIPRLEKNYENANVSITITDEARDYLLSTYCKSFGVRDAEFALQRIVGYKLMELGRSDSEKWLRISKEEIDLYLDEKPIPRGNFPENADKPGISKALSVSEGIMGNAFAIETVLFDNDSSLEITGLPRESAIDSVKIAITCIKSRYPGLLKDKGIHIHFGEGSVPKDGPSAGVAIFMSIYSAAIGKPIRHKKDYDIAYTGELSLTGGVFAVGGVYEKLQAACDSGCVKVFIPKQNYDRLDRNKQKQFKCKIIPVTDIGQVVEEVFA